TVASTALFGSMPSRQKASQLKTKNMDSAKEITRTSVVTMMVRKEKEPKNMRIMPMDHITARKGVAATMMAPKKERSARSAISAPRPKPQMVNLTWSDTEASSISVVQIGGPVSSIWMSSDW